jgi:hypothetical protein
VGRGWLLPWCDCITSVVGMEMGMEMVLSRDTRKCRHRHGSLNRRVRVGLLMLEAIAEKENIGGEERGE